MNANAIRYGITLLLIALAGAAGYYTGRQGEQLDRTQFVDVAGSVVADCLSAREALQAKVDTLHTVISGLRKSTLYREDQFRLGWWMSEKESGSWNYVCPKDDRFVVPGTSNTYLIGLWRQAINLKIELARNSPCGP